MKSISLMILISKISTCEKWSNAQRREAQTGAHSRWVNKMVIKSMIACSLVERKTTKCTSLLSTLLDGRSRHQSSVDLVICYRLHKLRVFPWRLLIKKWGHLWYRNQLITSRRTTWWSNSGLCKRRQINGDSQLTSTSLTTRIFSKTTYPKRKWRTS